MCTGFANFISLLEHRRRPSIFLCNTILHDFGAENCFKTLSCPRVRLPSAAQLALCVAQPSPEKPRGRAGVPGLGEAMRMRHFGEVHINRCGFMNAALYSKLRVSCTDAAQEEGEARAGTWECRGLRALRLLVGGGGGRCFPLPNRMVGLSQTQVRRTDIPSGRRHFLPSPLHHLEAAGSLDPEQSVGDMEFGLPRAQGGPRRGVPNTSDTHARCSPGARQRSTCGCTNPLTWAATL